MTIDEFKKNIAPHMKKGYVAMDKMGGWNWFDKKPEKSSLFYNNYNPDNLDFWKERQNGNIVELSSIFNIEPVDDWATGNSNFENLPRDLNEFPFGFMYGFTKVEFQKAYRKNAEKMLFWVKDVYIRHGKDTDLKIDKWVFDIELGDRIR